MAEFPVFLRFIRDLRFPSGEVGHVTVGRGSPHPYFNIVPSGGVPEYLNDVRDNVDL